MRESLRRLAGIAGVVVVSATPIEALPREWSEHIAVVSKGFVREKVLMVGDAPGDLNTSAANGILFYPIIAGDEEASWSQLLEKGFGRFFAGTYCDPYEKLLERLHQALPDETPWKEIT